MSRLDEIASQFDAGDVPSVDMENMPEERGGVRPAPYPGPYTFLNPPSFNFDVRKIDPKDETGKRIAKPDDEKVKRLVVIFDDQHPLQIVNAGAPSNMEYVGLSVGHRLSNSEWLKGPQDDKAWVSEMGFYLRGGFDLYVPKGATNLQWGEAINKTASQRFDADIEWDAFCDPDRKRYVYDEEQKKNVEDTKTGCGQRYAMRGFKKADGTETLMIPKEQIQNEDGTVVERFAETFDCGCGASVRCFPRLRNYRKASA